MTTTKSILQKFPFYQQAPKNIQHELEHVARPVHLNAGDYFVHEGDTCSQFALVCSGELRVFKISENGRQISLYYVRENEPCLINMLSIFLGIQSPASAIAETDIDALIIPADTFRNWMRTSDTIQNLVFAKMSQRIIDVITLVEEITFQKMDKRLSNYLLQSFSQQQSDSKFLAKTHQAIAEELGSAREVISRLLKEIERMGAIELKRGKITLKNESILQDILLR